MTMIREDNEIRIWEEQVHKFWLQSFKCTPENRASNIPDQTAAQLQYRSLTDLYAYATMWCEKNLLQLTPVNFQLFVFGARDWWDAKSSWTTRLCLACQRALISSSISIRQGVMQTTKHDCEALLQNGLLGWTEKIKPKTQASCPGSYVWLWSKTNNREGFTIIHENICLWLMRHYVLCRYKQYFQPIVLSANSTFSHGL